MIQVKEIARFLREAEHMSESQSYAVQTLSSVLKAELFGLPL
jgi:hypothetical protein